MCRRLCQWFCNLFRSKHKADKTKVSKKPKTSKAKLKSSLSGLTTDDITLVYDLPSDEFTTEEQVIRANGYEVLDEVLGKGTSGVVIKAKRLVDQEIVALKVMDISEHNLMDQIRTKTIAKNELFVMEKTSHPHIIKLFAHFLIRKPTTIQIYVFMQFAYNKSLSFYLRKINRPLTESNAKRLFAQILSAVDYMHRLNIAHRDLKTSNILLDHDMNALVSDFGLSRVTFRTSKGGTIPCDKFGGTLQYMAPEVLLCKLQYNQYYPIVADMWSLGIILYVMLNKAHPFDVRPKLGKIEGFSEMRDRQMNRRFKYSKHILMPPSEGLRDIINKLLEPNVESRIKMTELFKHNWIKNEIQAVLKDNSSES